MQSKRRKMKNPQKNEDVVAFAKLHEHANGKRVLEFLVQQYEEAKEQLIKCDMKDIQKLQGLTACLQDILKLTDYKI